MKLIIASVVDPVDATVLLHDKVFGNRNKKSWFCNESDSCSLVIVIRDKNDRSLKYSKQLAISKMQIFWK